MRIEEIKKIYTKVGNKEMAILRVEDLYGTYDVMVTPRVYDKYRAKIQEDELIKFTVLDDIPIGHKIALRDFAVGDTVIKYGTDIGKVVQPIKQGEHVHVHNLKTKRW